MAERERDEDEGGAALAPERPKLQPPRKFAVVLINDDYTPMDFVVNVLTELFALPSETAERVMLDIHEKGSGVAGIYTREIAETKVAQVNGAGQSAEHPLRCRMQEA